MNAGAVPLDDHVFLTGRPPILEFISFVKLMAVDGRNIPDGDLVNEWRLANDRVRELEATEAGFADNPPIADVDPALRAELEAALADPAAQRVFGMLPSRWASVPLDRLVVYQKAINLRYVAELKASVQTPVTQGALLAMAAGIGVAKPPVQISQVAGNAFAFASMSEDLRALDITVLDPSQVVNYVPAGAATAYVAIPVGYGPNFLSALQIANRLVLHNGSHRAYALRDLGVRDVPCLVQHVSRDEELDLAGVQDLKTNADRYLKDPRPPVLKDYFDVRLRKVVPVVRKSRLVQVQIAVQEGKVPAN